MISVFKKWRTGASGNMIAEWRGQVLACSEDTVVVEGNHYFPAESLVEDCFEPSDHRSSCAWKGEAHYFHVLANGRRNENAAWFYPAPKAAAANIAGRVAFWKEVTVRVA